MASDSNVYPFHIKKQMEPKQIKRYLMIEKKFKRTLKSDLHSVFEQTTSDLKKISNWKSKKKN